MKIALLALLGSILGVLGGAAIGIVVGIGWFDVFKTTDPEAVLVFFNFMPTGAIVGAAGGAILHRMITSRLGPERWDQVDVVACFNSALKKIEQRRLRCRSVHASRQERQKRDEADREHGGKLQRPVDESELT